MLVSGCGVHATPQKPRSPRYALTRDHRVISEESGSGLGLTPSQEVNERGFRVGLGLGHGLGHSLHRVNPSLHTIPHWPLSPTWKLCADA